MAAPTQLPETAKPKHSNQSEAGPAPLASPTAPMPRPASHLAPMPSDHPDFRSKSARLRCQPPRTNNCGTFKQPPSVAATSRPKPGNPFLQPPTKGTPPPKKKKKNHTEGCHTHEANPEPNTKHTETEPPIISHCPPPHPGPTATPNLLPCPNPTSSFCQNTRDSPSLPPQRPNMVHIPETPLQRRHSPSQIPIRIPPSPYNLSTAKTYYYLQPPYLPILSHEIHFIVPLLCPYEHHTHNRAARREPATLENNPRHRSIRLNYIPSHHVPHLRRRQF
ncbi:hypothetical protein [Encephalitozoon cuniculi GB-M1]|uniref:UPF0328 protein ECU03_0010 n=1 Tax=Encephalitozoon cuniculi (strain GB-M1) TaxID=284813 RepID=Y301_ENCCU|nr:uncharacterized protein ECU03_0010 [Encephalitozoon cuniculi GB-M1]Q8SW85.1 RecName: Full=UPF0328 protein ECU03_0010 [Encephalitozoon cuniculi GB-M1]CAD26148.1 hypothetical protein [Encephalitozoon cuniculi GB-M1]